MYHIVMYPVEAATIVGVKSLSGAVIREDQVLLDVRRDGLEGISAGDVSEKRLPIPAVDGACAEWQSKSKSVQNKLKGEVTSGNPSC